MRSNEIKHFLGKFWLDFLLVIQFKDIINEGKSPRVPQGIFRYHVILVKPLSDFAPVPQWRVMVIADIACRRRETARATLAGDLLMHPFAGSPHLMGNFRLGNQVTNIDPEDFSANISLLNIPDGR